MQTAKLIFYCVLDLAYQGPTGKDCVMGDNLSNERADFSMGVLIIFAGNMPPRCLRMHQPDRPVKLREKAHQRGKVTY